MRSPPVCSEKVDLRDQRLQLSLFRLLAEGTPVSGEQFAERNGLEFTDVADRLGRWSCVHTDDQGRVVAFKGLSIVEAPHRLRVDDRTLYAWCAWDTLFLPELIGAEAEVESTCPTTGETITLHVGPEGPSNVAPPEAVVSLLLPDSAFSDDTIASFCRFVHYFASPAAAEPWTKGHPSTFVTSVPEAYEIGRATNAATWGRALIAENAC
jgi:alkylmercury lyase